MPREASLPHPGIVLKEEFLQPLGISLDALAEAIDVPRSRINQICSGRQGISANIALRLGRFLAFDPQWFMNLQSKYDLSAAADEINEVLDRIRPCEAA